MNKKCSSNLTCLPDKLFICDTHLANFVVVMMTANMYPCNATPKIKDHLYSSGKRLPEDIRGDCE